MEYEVMVTFTLQAEPYYQGGADQAKFRIAEMLTDLQDRHREEEVSVKIESVSFHHGG